MLIKIFFVFFSAFVGLFFGIVTGSFFVPGDSGLEGPAIAIGYGFAGMLFTTVLSGMLMRRLSRPQLKQAFLIVSVLSVIVSAWLIYRFMTIKSEQEGKATDPVAYRTVSIQQPSDMPVGMGIARPHLISGAALYFYANPMMNDDPFQSQKTDSITFKANANYVDITYAPPWFWPELMKLDYDALLLRVVTYGKNWLEVIVNTQTGQTAWVDRMSLTYEDWPTFLMNVNSVEVLDAESNPVRLKPLTHASILASTENQLLRPAAVQGDWLRVYTHDLADRIPPEGWIRWKQDDRLLISYSLFE